MQALPFEVTYTPLPFLAQTLEISHWCGTFSSDIDFKSENLSGFRVKALVFYLPEASSLVNTTVPSTPGWLSPELQTKLLLHLPPPSDKIPPPRNARVTDV